MSIQELDHKSRSISRENETNKSEIQEDERKKSCAPLLAPFFIPYSYGDVKLEKDMAKFNTAMLHRSKELREIEKKKRDKVKAKEEQFIWIGCQLNNLMKLIYVQDKSQIKSNLEKKLENQQKLERMLERVQNQPIKKKDLRKMKQDGLTTEQIQQLRLQKIIKDREHFLESTSPRKDTSPNNDLRTKSIESDELPIDLEEMEFRLHLKGTVDYNYKEQRQLLRRMRVKKKADRKQQLELLHPREREAKICEFSSSSAGSPITEKEINEFIQEDKSVLQKLKTSMASKLQAGLQKRGSTISVKDLGLNKNQSVLDIKRGGTIIQNQQTTSLMNSRAPSQLTKTERKQKQYLEHSIIKYKERLNRDKKQEEGKYSARDYMEDDIKKGKYPEISQQRADLQKVYRDQLATALREKEMKTQKKQFAFVQAKNAMKKITNEEFELLKAKLMGKDVRDATPDQSTSKPFLIEPNKNVNRTRNMTPVPNQKNNQQFSTIQETKSQSKLSLPKLKTAVATPAEHNDKGSKIAQKRKLVSKELRRQTKVAGTWSQAQINRKEDALLQKQYENQDRMALKAEEVDGDLNSESGFRGFLQTTQQVQIKQKIRGNMRKLFTKKNEENNTSATTPGQQISTLNDKFASENQRAQPFLRKIQRENQGKEVDFGSLMETKGVSTRLGQKPRNSYNRNRNPQTSNFTTNRTTGSGLAHLSKNYYQKQVDLFKSKIKTIEYQKEIEARQETDKGSLITYEELKRRKKHTQEELQQLHELERQDKFLIDLLNLKNTKESPFAVHNPFMKQKKKDSNKGISLRNKDFEIKLNNDNEFQLEDMKQDLQKLKEDIDYNRYDPDQIIEQKKYQRSRRLEEFLVKHANIRGNSSSSDDEYANDTFHKEGGEAAKKEKKVDRKRKAKEKQNKVKRNKIMFVNRPSQSSMHESSFAESRQSIIQTNSSRTSRSYKTDNSYSSLNSEDRHFSDSLASETKTEFHTSDKSLSQTPLGESQENWLGTSNFKGQDTQTTILNQMVEKRNMIKYGNVKRNISTKEIIPEVKSNNELPNTLSTDSIVFVDQADFTEREVVKKQQTKDLLNKANKDFAKKFKDLMVHQQDELAHQMLDKYKNSHRQVQVSEFRNEKITDPLVQYYADADLKHKYPRSMGFIGKKSNAKQVNIENQFLSADYTDAFCHGIGASQLIQELNLRGASLNSVSSKKIISSMNLDCIKVLDFSFNPMLGDDFYEELSALFFQPKFKLEVLILEGNKMKDHACINLCQQLTQNQTLRELNLSQNGLSDLSVPDLCQVIYHVTSLESLFIHYNKIFGKGGMMIAQQLEQNRNIRIFDISFNSIGGGIMTGNPAKRARFKTDYAKSWSQCFKVNKTLIHVDIGNNNLEWFEMEIISDGLNRNHTILGIHVNGNRAKVDSLGFLHKESEYAHLSNLSQFGQIQPKKSKQLKGNKYGQFENCWLCEGWTTATIHYRPGVSDNRIDKTKGEKHDNFIPINMHMDCDNFNADMLVLDKRDNDYYETTRMVPPGDRIYFFSIAGKEYRANDHPTIIVKPHQQMTVEEAQNKTDQKQQYDEDDVQFQITTLPKINVLKDVPVNLYPFSDEFIKNLKVRPRETKAMMGARSSLRTPWIFKKSAFRLYKPDDSALMEKCFLNDYKYIESKMDYLIKDKDEKEQVKNILCKNYKYIRDSYKLAAGSDSQNDFMAIGQSALTSIMQNCGTFVDDKTLKLSDLDIERVAVKANDQKQRHKMIPTSNLIRYNFLEIFVRLAKQKFIQSKITDNFIDAITMLFDDYLSKHFKQFDSHFWRNNKLWVEDCDLAVKRQYKTIQRLYEKYIVKTKKPQKMLTPNEFADMVQDSGVLSEQFPRAELFSLWNLSMMTQVDEINYEKHLYMNFTEFVEAICRTADRLAIPNLQTDVKTTLEEAQTPQMIEQYSKRPLHEKIEAFLLMLSKHCLGRNFYEFTTVRELNLFKKQKLLANHIEVSGVYNKY